MMEYKTTAMMEYKTTAMTKIDGVELFDSNGIFGVTIMRLDARQYVASHNYNQSPEAMIAGSIADIFHYVNTHVYVTSVVRYSTGEPTNKYAGVVLQYNHSVEHLIG